MNNAEWFSKYFKMEAHYSTNGYLAIFGINTFGTQHQQPSIYKAWGEDCINLSRNSESQSAKF